MKLSLNFFKMFPLYAFLALIGLNAVPFNISFMGGKFYLLTLLIFTTYYFIQSRKSISINYLSLSMLVLIGYYALSIFWSINKIKGLILVIVWLMVFFAYYTPFEVTKSALVKFYKSFFNLFYVFGFIGIVIHLAGLHYDANIFPLNRNLAVYNLLLFTPAIFLVNHGLSKKSIKYKLNQMKFLIFVAAIIMYYSRFAYLNFLNLFIFIFIGLGNLGRLIGYGIKFFFAVALLCLYPPILDRLLEVKLAVELYIGLFFFPELIPASHAQRSQILLQGINLMKDYLWFGTGIGGYLDVLLNDYDEFKKGITPHNGVVRMIGELGIVGTMLFYFNWSLMAFASYREALKQHDYIDKFMCALSFGFISMYAVSQFFGETYNNVFILLIMMPAFRYVMMLRNDRSTSKPSLEQP